MALTRRIRDGSVPPGGGAARNIFEFYATGAAAMSETTAGLAATDNPLSKGKARIVRVNLKMSAAPTTSENFVVTLDSGAGTAYDTKFVDEDLAASSVTSLIWIPDPIDEGVLNPGDAVTFAYTNTDTGTWGLTFLIERI